MALLIFYLCLGSKHLHSQVTLTLGSAIVAGARGTEDSPSLTGSFIYF